MFPLNCEHILKLQFFLVWYDFVQNLGAKDIFAIYLIYSALENCKSKVVCANRLQYMTFVLLV